jgi:hypothetical protein
MNSEAQRPVLITLLLLRMSRALSPLCAIASSHSDAYPMFNLDGDLAPDPLLRPQFSRSRVVLKFCALPERRNGQVVRFYTTCDNH